MLPLSPSLPWVTLLPLSILRSVSLHRMISCGSSNVGLGATKLGPEEYCTWAKLFYKTHYFLHTRVPENSSEANARPRDGEGPQGEVDIFPTILRYYSYSGRDNFCSVVWALFPVAHAIVTHSFVILQTRVCPILLFYFINITIIVMIIVIQQ